MDREVAIVILNYKNWQDTLECITSILMTSYSNYRLIVVDNDSQNDSLEHISKWLHNRGIVPLCLTQKDSENGAFEDNRVVLIESCSNIGYSGGNNIGIRWAMRARSPYVLILNNDTIVKRDFLGLLTSFLDDNPDTALVGPKILNSVGNVDNACARRLPDLCYYFFTIGLLGKLFPAARLRLKHYYDGEYNFDIPKQVDVISGSCMLIRSCILNDIGLLDENIFLFEEEFILSSKLHQINKSTYIVPSSTVIHKHGKAIGEGNKIRTLQIMRASRHYYLHEYSQFGRINRSLVLADQCILHLLRSISIYIRNVFGCKQKPLSYG